MLSPLGREASVGKLFNDPDVINVADHVVDGGPHAGTLGGAIVYEGSYAGHLFNRSNIKV
jgi:excinuclease UvrABC ATPase subunit